MNMNSIQVILDLEQSTSRIDLGTTSVQHLGGSALCFADVLRQTAREVNYCNYQKRRLHGGNTHTSEQRRKKLARDVHRPLATVVTHWYTRTNVRRRSLQLLVQRGHDETTT